jgi:hypothetical protein
METDPEILLRAIKLWSKVMLLVLAVYLLLFVLDRQMKNAIVAESKALREEVARVRRGESPADQAGRSTADAGDDGLVPVADGPGAPEAAVADGDAGEAGKVDGIGRPPSRGGVNAGGTRIRPGELRAAVQSFAVA